MGGIRSRYECEEKDVSYFIRKIRSKVVTWVTGLGWEVYVREREISVCTRLICLRTACSVVLLSAR
jgi:hypothetical protein